MYQWLSIRGRLHYAGYSERTFGQLSEGAYTVYELVHQPWE